MIRFTVTPERIVTNQAEDVVFTAYQDGTATDIGTVTLGIVDANGDTVVSSGTATTDGSDGTYTYSLAAQTEPTLLYVTLTESGGDTFTVPLEVAGEVLFTELDARQFGAKANGTAPLNSATEYTDRMLESERNQISDLLEQWTMRSWVPRYARIELSGTGASDLWLGDGGIRASTGRGMYRPGAMTDIRSIISCTVNGTAVTASNIKFDASNGHIFRTDGSFTRATKTNPKNVIVEYTYGLDPWTDGARRIGLLLAVDRLVPSAISDRATSFTDELGTLRFETPGRFGNVSTLPEVNHWVKTHTRRIPIG